MNYIDCMEYTNMSEEDIVRNKMNICFEFLLPMRKFSINALEQLVDVIDLKQLVMTQDLTQGFIKDYVLNEKFQEMDDESTITPEFIREYQKYFNTV